MRVYLFQNIFVPIPCGNKVQFLHVLRSQTAQNFVKKTDVGKRCKIVYFLYVFTCFKTFLYQFHAGMKCSFYTFCGPKPPKTL